MLNKNLLLYALFFWILFVFLNSLFFVPAYLLDCQRQIGQIEYITPAAWWHPYLAGNYSIFYRFCGDFLLLFLPILFFKKNHWSRKIYVPIASFLYIFLLYYNIYLEGYQSMYSVHPIFENDWVIIKEILPTFLREISVKGSTYLIGTIIFLCFSILLFGLFYFLQKRLLALKKSPTFWGIGLVFLAINLVFLPRYKDSKTAVITQNNLEKEISEPAQDSLANSLKNPIFHWVYPAIQKSATLDRVNHLAHLDKRWIYDFYKNKKLVQKPNIFLLFVESYGGVAAFSDYCEAPYQALTSNLTQQLDSAGWYMASNYSKSTVIGGRSWLAMTTAMIGARIEDQIQYSELIKNRHSYPHLVDFLNGQGYETFRVSTMRIRRSDMDTLNMITIPNKFWKFDQRYFYPDIPYKGYQYDLYGGIPDQYTLSYSTDELLSKTNKPFFFTLITMNSHGPWHHKMPPIMDDWRSLNNLKNPFGNEEIDKDMRISSYWIAMEYQLKMLTNYIRQKGQDNSIYIILGDHNPGGLEYKLYKKFNKWATPIHIISKDARLIESFYLHGFTKGMQVDTSQYKMMRHMGLYSLLTRQLLENYGEEEVVLPEYLPWGLRF